MEASITAKFVPYEGPVRCNVGPIYGGRKCGKPAEVVTVYDGPNGWHYETLPRCRADAEHLLWDVRLITD
jgi:hypothetical protein